MMQNGFDTASYEQRDRGVMRGKSNNSKQSYGSAAGNSMNSMMQSSSGDVGMSSNNSALDDLFMLEALREKNVQKQMKSQANHENLADMMDNMMEDGVQDLMAEEPEKND